MKVKYIFMAVKLASICSVIFLSFHYCEWFIAAFISLFTLQAVTMQKEETENDWLEYTNEEEF